MERFLVVDKDVDARAATARLLSRLGRGIDVAETPDGALATVSERLPVLVILDVETGGLELCREIVEHSQRTGVILTSAVRTTSSDVVAGLLAGADDYMAKPFDPEELLARVRRTVARLTPASEPSSPPVSLSILSNREREVLGLLSQGLTQRQIASKLVISHKTVGTHIQHIFSKLGLHTRGQAVAYALGQGTSTTVPAPGSG